MGKTYHLWKRSYTNKKGKRYFYWWCWYYHPVTGVQIRKPAGRRCTNRREAEDFIKTLPEILAQEFSTRYARWPSTFLATTASG